MKKLSRSLFATVAFLAASVAGLAAEAGWTSDYSGALAKAKAENKLVLLDFTGSDWCGWCKKLNAEVFSQSEFQQYASEKLVLVEVDFPRRKKLDAATVKQNDELQDKFKIDGYPTIVVVDGNGKEIGRTGYLEGGPSAFNAELDRIAAAAK